MRYPKAIQSKIDVLDTYSIDETLKSFHILHMYPGKLAYPNGYYDSRFFTLWGFNLDYKKKRNLGTHDSIELWESETKNQAKVSLIRIFADGSTIVRFVAPVSLELGQAVSVFGSSSIISLTRSTEFSLSSYNMDLEAADKRFKNLQRDPNKEYVIALNNVMYEDYLVHFKKNRTTSIWLRSIEQLKGLSHDTRIILYTSYKESSIWKNPVNRSYLNLFPKEEIHSPNEYGE
jgi:hypothetical protein